MDISEEEIVKEQNRNRGIRITVLTAGIIISVIAVLAVYRTFFAPKKHYTGYDIIAKTERGGSEGTEFQTDSGRLISYDKEGISVYDDTGEVIWNAGLSMNEPEAVSAGNYIAIYDIGGRSFMVMEQNKSPVTPVTVNVGFDILQTTISEQGEAAVLMQDETGYMIQIINPFDKNNNVKAEIKTYAKEDGYALTLALSKDGSKLVTEYIKSDGNKIKSVLTFYNFTSTGENSNADRIVGIFPYKDTIFPKISFLNNDTVCAFGDNVICTFSMKHEPELMWEKKFAGKVLDVEENGGGLAFILETSVTGVTVQEDEKNKERLDEAYDGKKASVLFVFGRAGNKTVEREIEDKYSKMSLSGGEVTLCSDSSCLMLNTDGSVKYEGKFAESIYDIFPAARNGRYFLITGNYIEVLKFNE